jgi:riboflavin biosynthesis pyrimidine reductase
VLANFVSSADGRAAFQGRSGPLSDEGDRAHFHALRERVDAIMVGTTTLRLERYGRLIKDPEARERRFEHGLERDPLACVVTRSGEIPLDVPLFEEERVVVFAPAQIDGVTTVEIDLAELTLTTVLRCLHDTYGIRSLLCEGGPTLFGSLLEERLVDELFLTLAPKLVGGGTAPAITRGAELTRPAALDLTWLLEREGSLFARFGVSTEDG